MKITKIEGLELYDSRGEATLKIIMESECFKVTTIVPKGASKGDSEACEIEPSLALIFLKEKLIDKLIGIEFTQLSFDNYLKTLDGTTNYRKMGGNLAIGLSLSMARLLALESGLELYQYIGGLMPSKLPYPMFNLLNGGVHASNSLSIQEFMVVPVTASSFSDAVKIGIKIFKELKKILLSHSLSVGLGDEGGFAPEIKTTSEALGYLLEATLRAGYKSGVDVFFSLDVAANSFYNKERKVYLFDGRELSSEEMIEFYEQLTFNYPLLSLEDPLEEHDTNYQELTSRLKNKVYIIGDDLFVTNSKLLQEGIENQIATGLIIKPNQIGTLSETLETIRLAKVANYKIIVSHRSGDSSDDFISDLAYGVTADFIKSGSVARYERIAKYNRLIEIELKEEGN